MAISFENALGIHDNALKFRSQRASVLANNLANLNTPGFKARDMDFRSALRRAEQGGATLQLETTHATHQRRSIHIEESEELLYRTPAQPSIDGNSVEEHVEHANYMQNTLAFQASFTFLNSKFKGLTSALRGE